MAGAGSASGRGWAANRRSRDSQWAGRDGVGQGLPPSQWEGHWLRLLLEKFEHNSVSVATV